MVAFRSPWTATEILNMSFFQLNLAGRLKPYRGGVLRIFESVNIKKSFGRSAPRNRCKQTLQEGREGRSLDPFAKNLQHLRDCLVAFTNAELADRFFFFFMSQKLLLKIMSESSIISRQKCNK